MKPMSASDEKELDDAIAIATNFAEMSALGMVLDKYVEYYTTRSVESLHGLT